MADVFCSIDVPDWVIKQCGIERAGLIALLIIDIDESPTRANLESAAFLNGRIAASPQNYFLVQPGRGEYTGGTPTEEEGFGTEATQLTGADHAATYEVEGIKDNRDFWEGINRKKWKIGLFTNGGFIYYETNPVTIYAKINNPKGIKNGAFWSVSLKWQDYSNPIICNAPTILSSGLLA